MSLGILNVWLEQRLVGRLWRNTIGAVGFRQRLSARLERIVKTVMEPLRTPTP